MIDPKYPNQIKLEWEEWVDQFKPCKNPLKQASDDIYEQEQYRFETYGEERLALLERAAEIAKKYNVDDEDGFFGHFWTLVDWGEGGAIEEGFHIVNRLLHYITEVRYAPDKYYIVDEYTFDKPERSDEEEARIEEWIHNE